MSHATPLRAYTLSLVYRAKKGDEIAREELEKRLVALVMEHGSINGVAKALEINVKTCWAWFQRGGVVEELGDSMRATGALPIRSAPASR